MQGREAREFPWSRGEKWSKEICPKGKESWWPSPVDHDQRDQLFLFVRQLLKSPLDGGGKREES